MPARTPEEVPQLWVENINAGDVDGLVALYEPDATLVAQPGEVVVGIAAIQEVLSELVALRATHNLEGQKVLQTGDIALSFTDWALAGTGSDGEPIEMAAQSSDVLRRQPDGSWRFVIDNPWGSAHGL
jgi:uncharacterized protein (TIGR02246 family)